MDQELEETVSEAARGDSVAVEALLVRYLPDLRSYLERHASEAVRAREQGDDLAQSVCREVLERLSDERFEYRGEGQFRQWLYGAALLKLKARHRFHLAERRDLGRELGQSPGAPGAPGGSREEWSAFFTTLSSPSGQAARHEAEAQLFAALEELPERQRSILELVHLRGLTHREAAERLEITEPHSRVLLARAMARLARHATAEERPDR